MAMVTRYLAADGGIVSALPRFAQDRANLVELHEAMLLARRFDEKAISLQRTGRLGTYASALGQEAISVGAAAAMRERGGQLRRGVKPRELFLFRGGDERGSNFEGPRRDFPVSIPVASHIPHAAGVALAFVLRGERRVAVAIAGDGATSPR
jgi:pyruvate dehydrogenase E1 component alpha subunit